MNFHQQEVGNYFRQAKIFFSRKDVQTSIFLGLIILISLLGVYVRSQNLHLLVDSTTGENIPLALDPFYFLRMAETIVEQGGLPEYDSFRMPFNEPWSNEILPDAVVFLYKVANIFGEYSIHYINVLSPVIFFAIAMVIFFFLAYALTNSRVAAIISGIVLAFIPSYLYRTMAGFSDHESIGMLAFFAALLSFTVMLKFLDKSYTHYPPQKELMRKVVLGGLLTGLFSGFSIVAWGGAAKFLFMIIPISFLIFWLLKNKTTPHPRLKEFNLFFLVWAFSFFVFGTLLGMPTHLIFSSYLVTTTALGTPFMIGLMFFHYLFTKRPRLLGKHSKHAIIYSILATIFAGILLLAILGVNPLHLLGEIWGRLFTPIGTERVTLTVAENRQPYLVEFIGSIGNTIFWIMLAGLVVLGIVSSRRLPRKKDRYLFPVLWSFFVVSILFSRYAQDSLFNGANFASTALYALGISLFAIYLLFLYFKSEGPMHIDAEYIVLVLFSTVMLVAAKGSVRLFFLISPLVALIQGFFVSTLWKESFKKRGEDSLRLLFAATAVFATIILIVGVSGFYTTSLNQGKNTGPSANMQWQQAMEWVRGNTTPDAVFLHWWDYGYWVQTLGERPTLADGGHYQGSFRDHLIGRYVLTTPDVNTALSFAKTNDATHLLIDPTDIGKYSAYSRIGSDTSTDDRYSWIPALGADPRQTQETANSTVLVYSGGTIIDADIIYTTEAGEQIFLPAQRAGLAGIIVDIPKDASQAMGPPLGVYVYNNQQYQIPLRYLHLSGNTLDFGEGLESTVVLLQSIQQSAQGYQINPTGVAIYLSPKVTNSLVGQLYLLENSLGRYDGFTLAHSEPDPLVAQFNAQGAGLADFVYFGGIRGPLNIYEINPPSNVPEHEEFLRREGEFAEFDNLSFVA